MLIGFVDESGSPAPSSQERYFTVALLLVQEPRHVEKLVRRIRRSLRWRACSSELKADFDAWSFEQKYERGNDWAAHIISRQVIVENQVRGTKIAALPGGR